ncbi:unnamed protein product [Absidia cylindrospora]
MPTPALSLDALEEKGWFFNQEGFDFLIEQVGTMLPWNKLLTWQRCKWEQTDLRELTEKGFRKGDLTKLSQLPSPLVLQVLQIQNIAVPSIQHVEKPRLLRVVFTDGSNKKKWIGAEILGQVESISLHTPPGSKFLLTKPIEIREQLLILGPGMLTCLGGQVQEMIQAWKAGKQFIKRTKGNQTTSQEDLPPPFIPFKIKAGQATKEKSKEPKSQPASASAPTPTPAPPQIPKSDKHGRGNDNKNQRSMEKNGKRKDTPSKPDKKKDANSSKKEGGSTKKDAKPAKNDGGPARPAKKDSGSAKKETKTAKNDGGPARPAKKDSGSTKKETKPATKDGGPAKKETKPGKKDIGSAKKDTKPAKNEGRSANENVHGTQDKEKRKARQPLKDAKHDDDNHSNQAPIGDTRGSKNKNKSQNQRHPPTSPSSQKQNPPSLPMATPTVLSASSKPFIPSSFPVQQQDIPANPSPPSSRGRGNRGRGNRGRGRGRGSEQ